jgi:Sortase domain
LEAQAPNRIGDQMARKLAQEPVKSAPGKISNVPPGSTARRRHRKGRAGRLFMKGSEEAAVVAAVQRVIAPAVQLVLAVAEKATWEKTRPRGRGLHIASELALVAVLALTLGASWRDGFVSRDDGLAIGPAPAQVAEPASQSGGNSMVAGSDLAPPEPPVPTARPLELLIPALDVHRAVEPVGTNHSGVMNLPSNAWNAGWYKGGPVPGAPGDAVIEGHAGYPGQPMIFGRLVALKPGDRIIVVLADKTKQLFLVDSMSSLAVGTAPPGMAEPYGPPRLTLITCTGHFDKNSYSYSQRLVLEAHYAGLA